MAGTGITSRQFVFPREDDVAEMRGRLELTVAVANDIAAVVGDAAAALVSVMGNSKGGKSSLSNLLSTRGSDWDRGPFRVSGANEACTAGIDVSWPPEHDPSGQNVRLLWADCEGRGVRGTPYDLQLGTVAAAVSSVVIYNRTGTLAKEDVMNDLKTLADAATRLCGSLEDEGSAAGEAAGAAPAAPAAFKFGHLHIVIRDYNLDADMGGLQFEAAHAAAQWERIASDERLPVNARQRDAALARNRSRAALRAAFKSITVWLMPQPTAVDPAMRVLFLRRVTELRAAVVAQAAASPATFGGAGQQHVITGHRLALLLPDIVRAANGRAALAPASLFADMQRRVCSAAEQEAEALCAEYLAVLQSEAVTSSPSPAALRAMAALWLDAPVLAFRAKLAAVVGGARVDDHSRDFMASLQLRVALVAKSCHDVRERLAALLAEAVVASAQEAVRARLDAAVAALTALAPASEADAAREHAALVAAFDTAAEDQLAQHLRRDTFVSLAGGALAPAAAAAPADASASPVGCDAFWDAVRASLRLLHGDDQDVETTAPAVAATFEDAAAAIRVTVSTHPMWRVAHAATLHELTRAMHVSQARHAAAQVAAEQARVTAAGALVREGRTARRAQALAVAAGSGLNGRSVAQLLGSTVADFYTTPEGQAALAAALSALSAAASDGSEAAVSESFEAASDHAARFPQLWLDACVVPVMTDVLVRAGLRPGVAGCVGALLCEVLQHTEDAVEVPDAVAACPRFVAALGTCAAAGVAGGSNAQQWCNVLQRLAVLPSCGLPLLEAGAVPQLLAVLQAAAARGPSRNLPLFAAAGSIILDLAAAAAIGATCPLLAAAEQVFAAVDNALAEDTTDIELEIVCRLFAHVSLAPTVAAEIAGGGPTSLLARLVARLDFYVSTSVADNIEAIGTIASALPPVSLWVPGCTASVIVRALRSTYVAMWSHQVELLLRAAAAMATAQPELAAEMVALHVPDVLERVLGALEGHGAVTKAAYDLWEALFSARLS